MILLSSVLVRGGRGLVLEHASRMFVRAGAWSRGPAGQRFDTGLVDHLIV